MHAGHIGYSTRISTCICSVCISAEQSPNRTTISMCGKWGRLLTECEKYFKLEKWTINTHICVNYNQTNNNNNYNLNILSNNIIIDTGAYLQATPLHYISLVSQNRCITTWRPTSERGLGKNILLSLIHI